MALKTSALLPGVIIAIFSFAAAIVGVGVTHSVSAHEGHTGEHTSNMETESEVEKTTTDDKSTSNTSRAAAEAAAKEKRATAEAAAKERREAAKQKLSEAKLKVCNSRKANIDRKVARISERVAKQLATFDSISERAQKFYVTKGNTLKSYDALVADVAAKKAAATAAVDALNAQKTAFTCESTEPKAAVTTYKANLTSTIAVLKEYRASIKDLIVGIKSANATTDKQANEETR